MSYSDIQRVQEWYLTALDGISNLASQLSTNDPRYISEATRDAIFGMTEAEWKTFHSEKQEDHEIAASLALLATCEGGIRRDLEHRISGNGLYHNKLRPLVKPGRHVSIIIILQKWANVIGSKSGIEKSAQKQIKTLEDIFSKSRNTLAHGRARHGEFTFDLLMDKLQLVERKWKNAASDFAGF